MGNVEDLEDMLAFQGGDEEGFQRLFRRYSGPLLHYLCRYTSNRSVAEELVQEVFLRVCRAAGTYEPRTAFRTWLYRIATNVAKNEIRRREYAVKKEPLDALNLWRSSRRLGGGGVEGGAASPEDLTGARQMEEAIQAILREMPERQRAALLLCRHQGLSYREIADVMGLRVGAVKSLIHRAMQTLKIRLDAWSGTAACGKEERDAV